MRPNVFTCFCMLLLMVYVLFSVGIAIAIPNLDKPKDSFPNVNYNVITGSNEK